MQEFISWLGQQAIALIALLISVYTLIQFLRFKKGQNKAQKEASGPIAPVQPIKKQVAPHLEFYPVEDITHVIRNQKLVNRLSLHFRNSGNSLYYDNVEFSNHNKRLEVEILSEQELEIFSDPREDQKVAHMESLRVTFEREIGDPMAYDFKIFYQDKNGNLYSQHVTGQKGEDPQVYEPVEIES